MTAIPAAYVGAFGAPEGYLNFASYGPPSSPVVSETARLLELAHSGADSGQYLHAMDRRATGAAARLSGFAPQNVGLVPSTSHGLFQAAFGVSGGEVLVSSAEFPANLYPWWRARDAGLLQVRTLPENGCPLAPVTPERVRAALTESTVAVSVSAVDFRTGYRADLAGIREAVGDRLLVVDGIQGFGAIELPWDAADVLVAGGQKWMRAGWGCGFMALSDRALERLGNTLGGWTAVNQPTNYDGVQHPPLDGAARLSVTNGSPFASGALSAALELAESAGVEAIEAAIAERMDYFIDRLDEARVSVASPRAREDRAGIVVAEFSDGSAPAMHERLAEAGITATLHGSTRIRLSVHATTTEAAVDTAATILKGTS
ncbi:aminotransferase class V-fold PLP-dependent enzyme [Arthrobacter sp. zg-Y40]|uniref:aminotransferase class V-fold PLP-dependent enzyme n=1 Tax=Arthrobacter sp. zg-Y40 TaxID=2886939 RepID=UPI001D136431|nr:aminotransferase class V-fold PLP-dependent enzyme [Arthrobacter sp. zg-Y40]MCC3279964.1 aminotransferase class V-fold PLP-dependent enzyme [Arthrobacter sp. zg-Y40]